ncbi:MAG: xylulose kinase [Candidatus Thorarchaeota archaeon]|nr:xylulose kinase [Candidatus Thorarchaeota archaeon]
MVGFALSSTEKKYLLAVDHGTSAMKVALTDHCGQVLAFEFEKTPLYLKEGGGAEQDPDEWWSAFVNCCKRLIDSETVPAENIAGVSVSSQWSGTVPVDEDGRHLWNAIIWMDTRGEPYIKKALRGLINIQGYSITNLIRWLRKTAGIPAGAGKDPIAHILFLKNEHPDVYESTYKFLECKDFLNAKLTGKFAASYDSIMLHWMTDIRDIWNMKYDYGLIKKIGVSKDKLPVLMKATDILGSISGPVADELGLQSDTKVVMGSPDLHSAIIGSGAVRNFEGHIYIGTSSWVICHVPFKKTDISHNMASLPSSIPGRYFVANEQESAGACLTFLRDNVFFSDDPERYGKQEVYQEFDRIVEEVPAGSNRLIFTPWLYGERTPVEDHTLRGGFHNLSLPVKREDMIRAVFEGVAYNSKWLMGLVEKFIKRKMDSLNIIGGGAQSDIWCQIYADVLNRTIRRVKDPIYANARGAALIGAVGLGMCTFDEIPSLIQFSKEFHPNPENRAVYDGLYKEFLNIYKNNKAMYRRLNK